MNILVCGFMGSGKTTFVQKLSASVPDWKVCDLDHEIARELSLKNDQLGDWIRKEGIPAFRQQEFLVLTRLLNDQASKLIALGGGTLESPAIFDLIRATDTRLVYLNVPLEICLERTEGDSNRPLRALSPDALKKLHTEREQNYLRSDLILREEEIKGIEAVSTLMHNLKGR